MNKTSKPLTETEFRFLVELRQAAGGSYRSYAQLSGDPSLEAWVEYFALEMGKETPFEEVVAINYPDILDNVPFILDHSREHYDPDGTHS